MALTPDDLSQIQQEIKAKIHPSLRIARVSRIPLTDGQVYQFNDVTSKLEPVTLTGIAGTVAIKEGNSVVSGSPAGTLDFAAGFDITISASEAEISLDLSEVAEQIQDVVGAMLTGNTETGITVTYEDGDGTIDFVVGTVAIAGGGTGQTTQQAAIDALTAVSGASTDQVLTKDGSGNATFQDASGGGGGNIQRRWYIDGTLSAGAVQGPMHASMGDNETVERIVAVLKTAGTACTFTLDFSDAEDYDSHGSWTEIDSVAMGSTQGYASATGFTNATITARRLISLSIDTITGSPADLTVILETSI